jgi:NAD-dependent SIR2 family protein deacetylase
MGKVIASCGHELGPDEGPDGHGYPVSWEEYDGPDLVTCHATYCRKCSEALEAYQGAALWAERRKELSLNIPPCPKCGSDQIQLVEWIGAVKWRCRSCGHT